MDISIMEPCTLALSSLLFYAYGWNSCALALFTVLCILIWTQQTLLDKVLDYTLLLFRLMFLYFISRKSKEDFVNEAMVR